MRFYHILAFASAASARCVQSILSLPLSATNYDLSTGQLDLNKTLPVSGTFKVEVHYCPPTAHIKEHADTLLVLLPGSTYDPSYWDFKFQPETYSFVRYANARGFAALNIARIGQSPPSPTTSER